MEEHSLPPEAETEAPAPPQKDVEPAFLSWLSNLCGTRDFERLDPLSIFPGYIQAPPRGRVNTRIVPMTFEGSAAGFQYSADHGFRARLTIADALEGRPKALAGLRPHAQRALDAQQGVTPLDHDMEGVLINSVMLMEPHNTLSQSVGIMTSTLPAVYAQLKRRQTEELSAELGVTPVHPDVVAHIPPSEKPDTVPVPVLKVWHAFIMTLHDNPHCDTHREPHCNPHCNPHIA